jgi:hypothetical protein
MGAPAKMSTISLLESKLQNASDKMFIKIVEKYKPLAEMRALFEKSPRYRSIFNEARYYRIKGWKPDGRMVFK